ncbi:MAG: ion channel [Paracoccaceae bacterium]
MAFLIGFALVAVVGVFHHVCLRGLDRLTGRDRVSPNATILVVFLGLLTLHTAEIAIWMLAYAALLRSGDFGQLAGAYQGTWGDLFYYSGINFTTLGYTQIEASGDIRAVGMMQSLGGFMVLTWSATFIYSAWERAFRLQPGDPVDRPGVASPPRVPGP